MPKRRPKSTLGKVGQVLAGNERSFSGRGSSVGSASKVRSRDVAAKKRRAQRDGGKKAFVNKDVQFGLVEVRQCGSEQDEDSDQDDDAYTQAHDLDSNDDFDLGSEDEESNEPLRPGDLRVQPTLRPYSESRTHARAQ